MLASQPEHRRLHVRIGVRRADPTMHVREVRRVVLVRHVSARRIQEARQVLERDVARPEVAHLVHSRRMVAAGRMRQPWERRVPEVEDIPGPIGVRVVRRHERAQPHGVLPFGQRSRVHHVQELLAGAELAVASGARDIDRAGRAVHDPAERHGLELARLAREALAVEEFHAEGLARDRQRRAVQQIPVGIRRIGVERVDLREVAAVAVGRRPAEIPVEAADDDERTADAEIAVEVDDARHRQVRLVVAGRPRQMRISEQDRMARLRPARRERPRVRPVVRGRFGAVGRHRGFGRVRGSRGPAGQGPDEPTHARRRRSVPDVQRGDIVSGEVRRRAFRELVRVQLDVAVHAGGESVVQVARLRLEEVIGRDGAGAAAERLEVRIHRPAPEHSGRKTTRLEQAHRRPLAVVLALNPRQRVAAGSEVRGADVRHAVRGANHLDVVPQFGGRRGEGAAEDEDKKAADDRGGNLQWAGAAHVSASSSAPGRRARP